MASLKGGVIVGPERHRFRLSTSLGEHPYGMLWKAEDLATSSKTEVTLLFLPDILSQHSSCIEALRKLVILSRKSKHPNALTCYGLFSHKGAVFLAFEQVDGLTLANMLEKNQVQKLKPEQKQGLVIQTAKALDAFHRETRKSHSSLSPELIFISTGRGVRLMMMGWRQVVDEYLDLMPGQPLYRQYQAPEGFDPLPTTQKSDVYALAAIIYHIYAGKPAFLPNDDEKSRFQRELKAPNGLDANQWKYLQQALSPDQETRQTSALQLVKQLYSEQETESEVASVMAEEESTSNASASLKKTTLITKLGLNSVFAHLPNWGTRTYGILIFITGLLVGALLSFWFRPDITSYEAEINRLQTELEASQSAAQAKQGDSPDMLEAIPEPETFSEIETGSEEEALPVSLENTQPTSTAYPSVSAQPTERQSMNNDDLPEGLRRFQDHFGESGFAPVMQTLPAGEFLMGDLNRVGDDNERPVREISFNYAFAIGTHEVTFAEYDQFATATGQPLPDDAGWGRDDRPVINVTWEDAQNYTRWLRDVTGQPYRLPTEAEWEYAARAGTVTAWWWGNELEPGMAVCDGCGTQWDAQQTAPVGQLPANSWGFKDMHGNVDEWVEDCYSDHYTQAPEDGSAMQLGNCNLRVLRGGSWFDLPRVIRSSSRYREVIDTRKNTYGFRVALDLPNVP